VIVACLVELLFNFEDAGSELFQKIGDILPD
jgi:hypothetical protein